MPLAELRRHPPLAAMPPLQRGKRLSITPVNKAEWAFIGDPVVIWLLSYLALGVFAGFFAGLLGIGGGLVMVPVLAVLFAARGPTGRRCISRSAP